YMERLHQMVEVFHKNLIEYVDALQDIHIHLFEILLGPYTDTEYLQMKGLQGSNYYISPYSLISGNLELLIYHCNSILILIHHSLILLNISSIFLFRL